MSEGEYDDGVLLADIERSPRERYRVRLCEFKGKKFIDLRVWYLDHASDEYRPGKGTTIRPAALGEVIEALRRGKQLLESESR